MQRILYAHPDGSVAILIPAPNCGLTIHEIAQKDVPAGVSYQIVDTADIPTDRTFRNAWEVVLDHPSGVAIGSDLWHKSKESA